VAGGGRLLADPNKLLLVADCSNYSLADRNLPALCGWWDTPAKPGVFAPQLGTVKVIVPGLQLLILLLLAIALFRRSQRGLTQAWLFSGVVAGALSGAGIGPGPSDPRGRRRGSAAEPGCSPWRGSSPACRAVYAC